MSSSLDTLLASRRYLLADGAMGTNLFVMGLGSGDAPEPWNVVHADRVASLHRQFVRGGSDIILTNSFGGNRYRLALHGMSDRVAELNEAAGRVARGVADEAGRTVLVAGSMGPTGELFQPLGALSHDQGVAAFSEQAQALARGGVDLLWIETMSSREELEAALTAADTTAIPAVCTLSFDTNGRTMMGITPGEFAAYCAGRVAPSAAFGTNCGQGAAEAVAGLVSMGQVARPEDILVAKANCGIPEFVDGDIRYNGTPQLMADYACLALDAGARVIGGCCGTTPTHIETMRRALDAHRPGERPSLRRVVDALGEVSAGARGVQGSSCWTTHEFRGGKSSSRLAVGIPAGEPANRGREGSRGASTRRQWIAHDPMQHPRRAGVQAMTQLVADPRYRTVMVTGGAGFIGSAVVRRLVGETDTKVINVDKLTYAGNTESLSVVEDSSHYVFEQVDICDIGEVRRVLEHHRPDAIMHLAAESHVDRSIDGPGVFLQTNVMGTFVLLQESRRYRDGLEGTKRDNFRFHHVSTDEVYGSLGAEGYFTEASPYRPNSPYSASKASADHIARSWHKTFDLPVVISNCSNNYGPYQFPEKLIPLTILNAHMGRPLPVYGTGQNVRDWLYVDDHVSALWRVLTAGRTGECYLIGGRSERANIEVVRGVCAILDRLNPSSAYRPHHRLIRHVTDRPGHDLRYAIDPGKVERELGWRPVESFESGLEKTVQWYLANDAWCHGVEEEAKRRRGLGKGDRS